MDIQLLLRAKESGFVEVEPCDIDCMSVDCRHRLKAKCICGNFECIYDCSICEECYAVVESCCDEENGYDSSDFYHCAQCRCSSILFDSDPDYL